MKINYNNKIINRQIRQGFGINILKDEIPKLHDSKVGGHPSIPNGFKLEREIIEEYTMLFQLNLGDISFDRYGVFENKMIYVFIAFENRNEGEFSGFKVKCFDLSSELDTVELKNMAGVNRKLKLTEYYGLNTMYDNDVLIPVSMKNNEDLKEFNNLKEALEEQHFFGNYFLGVKDGGPGNPDITWTGLTDFPDILTGKQEINEEVLKAADQYEMLFCLSPYNDWGFFDEDVWTYSIRIGIKRSDLEQGNFDKIVVGY